MVITHLRYCIVLHLPAGGGGEEKKKKKRQTFTSGVKKKAPEPCIDWSIALRSITKTKEKRKKKNPLHMRLYHIAR